MRHPKPIRDRMIEAASAGEVLRGSGIELLEDWTDPIAEPELYDKPGADGYDRIGRFALNDGLPVLKVQWDLLQDERALVAALGSWRSGKTRAGALKVTQAASRNPWRRAYGRSNPKSTVIGETMSVLRESAFGELLSVVPEELILKTWESSQNFRIRFVNGHDVVLRSWKGKIEGLSASGIVWIDEVHKLDGPQGPEHIWKNLTMRSTDPKGRDRQVVATGVPEYGFLSEIFDRPDDVDRACYLCSLVDNFYLEEADLAPLYASTTPEEAEVVIFGRWRKPENIIYYAFRDGAAGNLVNLRGDPRRPVDLSIDLGDKGAILVSQRIRVRCRDATGLVYWTNGVLIVDEVLPENKSVRDALLEFKRTKPWKLNRESKIYVDPTIDRDEKQAIEAIFGIRKGANDAPRIRRQARMTEEAAREYGYRCVNSGFRDFHGNRRLFLSSALGRGRRSIITACRSFKRDEKGKPVRDNFVDHTADCLRYIAVDQLPLREASRIMAKAA